MFNGLIDLPAWGYVAVALAFTHGTIAGVTIYLHRHQAHRAINLHPAVSHVFRFWLWVSTGMGTRAWTAVHRKHHAFVETDRDPHSPQVQGLRRILLEGAEAYQRAAREEATLAQFGHGTPDDWIERHLYTAHPNLGIGAMLALNFLLFGFLGLTIWAVQMMWIPIFAAGIVNGVGHYAGYRNYESADASRNISPIGILIGGEELHNNHHAFASSAKFSARWWEFDLGWFYICLLRAFGLASVKKLAPRPYVRRDQPVVDLETVHAVVGARLEVMRDYTRQVVRRVYRDELDQAGAQCRAVLRAARGLLHREHSLLNDDARMRLSRALDESRTLATVYQYRQRLQALWNDRGATPEHLRHLLQEWCHQAEQTGVKALEEFARVLRGYALAPAAV